MTEITESVEDQLKKDQELYKAQIEEAIRNAPSVETNNGKVVGRTPPSYDGPPTEPPTHIAFSLNEEPNKVLLQEPHSHLYPWLCKEAMQQLKFDPNFIEKATRHDALHEFAHLAVAHDVEGLTRRLGISFFKVHKQDGKVLNKEEFAVQPLLSLEGTCTMNEGLRIINANAHDDKMSQGDKEDSAVLENLLNLK